MQQTEQILTPRSIFSDLDKEIYDFFLSNKDNIKSLPDLILLLLKDPDIIGLISSDRRSSFYSFYGSLENSCFKEIIWHIVEKYASNSNKVFEDEYEKENFLPLFITLAKRNNLTMVKFLLFLGLDVNATTKDGDTALILVSVYGKNIEMAQLLIDAGANINHQNDLKKSALSQAIRYNHPEMVKKLLQNGARLPSHLKLTISPSKPNTLEIIEFLLAYGAKF